MKAGHLLVNLGDISLYFPHGVNLSTTGGLAMAVDNGGYQHH
jgi:hypothetical protein